jgi:hypothetical protein
LEAEEWCLVRSFWKVAGRLCRGTSGWARNIPEGKEREEEAMRTGKETACSFKFQIIPLHVQVSVQGLYCFVIG